MGWFSIKEEPALAEVAEWNFKALKKSSKGVSVEDIAEEVEKLHAETRRIKRAGVSMWNYKEVLPKIFDVVDGAFVVMKENVAKQAELETRIEELEKKNDVAK